ncbi:uncharacterized protein Dwil_GK19054 [Drosophila willistoni]|uniref:Uncharacterized protein n=1 Tax=Drosophila willistoni TaxID=7260 RepID=B4MUF4_DROWI|nr:uncharacterized protein LOC6641824 [Drosophila willistoni]EDW76080.2 uncharacterized protein Dwil_GK19054 [Drosophila willistoni]
MSVRKLIYKVSIIFVSCLSCCLAAYLVRVDHFNFHVDDPLIILSQSAFIEQDVNRSYLSGHLLFSEPLKDIILQTSLDINRPKLPRMRLFDVRLEICHIMNNGYKNKFVRQFYNNFASFVNENATCPLKPHFNYTLNRAYVNDDVFPDFLPECTYRMKLIFQHKSKTLAHIQLDGRLSKAIK